MFLIFLKKNLPSALFLTCFFTSPLFAELNGQMPLLGYAYDEEKERVLSQAVEASDEPAILYVGKQSSNFHIKHDMTFEELLFELKVKTHGKLSIEIFDIQSGIDFISTSAKSDLSNNITYVFEVSGKKAILNGAKFTKKAQQLIDSRHPENKKKFFGNQFVSQVDLGGKLIASLSMTFANKKVKNEFHGKFKMDILHLLSMEAEGTVLSDQIKHSASIQVSATQIGGDPSQLAKILRNHKTGGSPIIQCGLDNLKPCKEALDAILNYGENFANQLSLEYNPSSQYGAAILGSVKSDYAYYGLNEVNLGPTMAELAEIQHQRERLLETYFQYSKDSKKIDKLFEFVPSKSESIRLRALQSRIQKGIRDLLSAIQVCYDEPGLCLKKVDRLELSEYSENEISFEWTFYNYCEFVRDNAPIMNTVARVRKAIPDGEHETCLKLEQTLEKMRNLDLSYKEELGIARLSDLNPISNFHELKKLDLNNNQVCDLTPLSNFNKLEILLAVANRLFQFPDLCILKNILKLDLSFNTDMYIESNFNDPCIENLKNTKFLSVRNAKFEDGAGPSFVKAVESASSLKQYRTLFTSNWDVCEAQRLVALESGLVDSEDYRYCKKRNRAIEHNGIFYECSDEVTIP